ncbi:MAG: type II toxin-antitoxin system HicA family toxin [Clostridiales bacterium]|jgi:predicted RNA binding protein YcfA (HicA-like mRNA interferase family)|nr:type II toxin-antitoxin system HicA family toxin [Clostridiales bacterium]
MPMKYGELKKLLKKNGCRMERGGANHEIWYSAKTEKRFPVGRHDSQEVKTGTLNAILKDAGLKEKE